MKTSLLIALCTCLIPLSGCVFWPAAQQYPDGVESDAEYLTEATCESTQVKPIFTGEPSPEWQARVEESAKQLTRILRTPEFASSCQSLRLTRTNGNTVQQVCRQLVCGGSVSPSVGFYHNPGTRAIAYETEGALFINTAKQDQGAGGPGNLAHELTHTLGYTHFTNWAILGKTSVPYRVGSLVDQLAGSSE